MPYGVCFHVNELICVYLMWMTPAEDTGGREWWCANVEWCVQWFPVDFVCEVFINMSNEGSSLIKFIWIDA